VLRVKQRFLPLPRRVGRKPKQQAKLISDFAIRACIPTAQRATLENPRIWTAANKFAAKRLLCSGAVLVPTAVVLYLIPGISVEVYSLACLFLFAVPFIIGLLQSIRYVKSLARQTP
jgi:hypothetical protein